jgi:hypothetical protein
MFAICIVKIINNQSHESKKQEGNSSCPKSSSSIAVKLETQKMAKAIEEEARTI